MALARSCTEQNCHSNPERFWGFFNLDFQPTSSEARVCSGSPRAPTRPSFGVRSRRVDSHGQRGVVVEQHAFRVKDSIPVFHREPNGHIEKTWDPHFGDRKIEIVIIGQDLDELHIRQELDACLVPAHLLDANWEEGYMDTWPVEKGHFCLDEEFGQIQFTCGPSRTEAEHPQPRFGQVGLTNSINSLEYSERNAHFEKQTTGIDLIRIVRQTTCPCLDPLGR